LDDRLDPEERFRATIQCLAREDDVDAERLSRTCPQRVYRENDRAFGQRLQASRIVAEIFVFSVLPALEKLEMLGGLSNLLGRALEGAADQVELAYEIGRLDAQIAPDGAQDEISTSDTGRELRKPIDEGRERITEFLDGTRGHVATEAKSLLEAFDARCRDQMGVEPETLLRAHFAPFVDRLSSGVLNEVEGEPELVEDRRRVLTQAWADAVGEVA
jgi:hypothetical protein